jgi:hypothetical protein
MTIWYICFHLVHFSGLGIMNQEKSGNPSREIEYRQGTYRVVAFLITNSFSNLK